MNKSSRRCIAGLVAVVFLLRDGAVTAAGSVSPHVLRHVSGVAQPPVVALSRLTPPQRIAIPEPPRRTPWPMTIPRPGSLRPAMIQNMRQSSTGRRLPARRCTYPRRSAAP